MAPMRVTCLVMGHRWRRERRPDRTVLRTCRRCGKVDVVDRDLGFGGMRGFGGG